jgi:hypothetical protein
MNNKLIQADINKTPSDELFPKSYRTSQLSDRVKIKCHDDEADKL